MELKGNLNKKQTKHKPMSMMKSDRVQRFVKAVQVYKAVQGQ